MKRVLEFAIGLAGGKVQLFVWAAVLIGGGIFIANHQRVVKEKAMLEQMKSDLEERAKKAELDYGAALESIELERAKVANLQQANARDRAAIAGVRSQISTSLAEGFAGIAERGRSIEIDTRAIPASQLDDRIRAAIARARASDVDLARIRATQ
jgi:hypothetical protein